MSKIAHYLQEHLNGEVMESPDARRYFATDGSILYQPPSLIVYPRNENDIRKTARFTWQLAERGRVIPLSFRGVGSDINGAAIGAGVMMVFPAHLNRILELDNKDGSVTVEPGINFAKLQQTLITHNKYLPVYPVDIDNATVGGVLANATNGAKSYKYGSINNFVKSIRVVLANGEVIDVKRLSKRELKKKLGLSTFEGEVYRGVDRLLEESAGLVEKTKLEVNHNSAGYNLKDIKTKEGFDLTPLFIGSQGTLGVITEIKLKTIAYNPDTTLISAQVTDLNALQAIANEFKAFKSPPSSIEFVNKALIDQVNEINPNYLKNSISSLDKEYIIFIEIDDQKQGKLVKKTKKMLKKYVDDISIETDPAFQEKIWRIREASSIYIGHTDGNKRATPLIEEAAVSEYKIGDLIDGISQMFTRIGIKNPAMWGHLGDAVVHFYPKLAMSELGDKQTAFRLIDGYYKLVISLGGTISSENSDGRMKAPYLEMQYGSEVYSLLKKVKEVFDPHNVLSPGVKFGTSRDSLIQSIKSDHSIKKQYEHLPKS